MLELKWTHVSKRGPLWRQQKRYYPGQARMCVSWVRHLFFAETYNVQRNQCVSGANGIYETKAVYS